FSVADVDGLRAPDQSRAASAITATIHSHRMTSLPLLPEKSIAGGTICPTRTIAVGVMTLAPILPAHRQVVAPRAAPRIDTRPRARSGNAAGWPGRARTSCEA